MSRSTDEDFEKALKEGQAVEDYCLKQLRKVGYSGSLDHRLMRPKMEDRQHSCQSDLGDVCLWHEDYGTTIADFKSVSDLNAFKPGDDYLDPPDEVFSQITTGKFDLWIAQDTSIAKILASDIDISHYEFYLSFRPDFVDGPDGDPQVASHIPWLLKIPGNSFPTWTNRFRDLSGGRRRSWYQIATSNPAIELIDLSLETIKFKQYTSHNPTAGGPFDWLHQVSIDLNSYKQEN